MYSEQYAVENFISTKDKENYALRDIIRKCVLLESQTKYEWTYELEK